MLLFCSGLGCQRAISVSAIPGGNPVALKDPEHFAVVFSVCVDCKATFCDRCAVPRRGTPPGPPRCRKCDGELIDGAMREAANSRRYPDPVQRYNEAAGLHREGRSEQAAATFAKAVALRPSYVAAHLEHGRVLRALGRHDEAAAAFDRVVELDPEHYEAMVYRGDALARNGQHEAALGWYDRALRVRPRYLVALVSLASTLNTLGRFAEAVEAAQRVDDLSRLEGSIGGTPGIVSFAHTIRAMALLNQGRDEEAVDAADAAIETGPDDPDSYRVKSLALDRLGRRDEAELARRLQSEAASRARR